MPSTIADLQIKITNSATGASKTITSMVSALERYRSTVYSATTSTGTLVASLNSLTGIKPGNLQGFYKYIDSIRRIVAPLAKELDKVANGMKAIGGVKSLGTGKPGGGISTSGLQTKTASLTSDVANSNAGEKLSQQKKDIEETSKATDKLNVKIESTSSGIGKLASQFGRLLKMKVLRTIINEILKGFSEGIGNLYQYSAALGSIDSTHFKDTMDGYASSMLYMKNSVAAAVAPLLQQLLPVVQTLVGWFVTATQAVSQFFAALGGGGTYTRAKEGYAAQFAEIESAAGGASASAKELQRTLMGFDEINKLDNPDSGSGGGGGGGGASVPNYADMFEEATIDSKFKDLADKVKPILEGLKDIGESLKNIWESDFVQNLVGDTLSAGLGIIGYSLESIAHMLGGIDALLNGDIPTAVKEFGDGMFDASRVGNEGLEGIVLTFEDILPLPDEMKQNMKTATKEWFDDLNEKLDAGETGWNTFWEEVGKGNGVIDSVKEATRKWAEESGYDYEALEKYVKHFFDYTASMLEYGAMLFEEKRLEVSTAITLFVDNLKLKGLEVAEYLLTKANEVYKTVFGKDNSTLTAAIKGVQNAKKDVNKEIDAVQTYYDGTRKKIEDAKIKIKANLDDAYGAVYNFKYYFDSLDFSKKATITTSLSSTSGYSSGGGGHYTYASGGYPTTGSMFIAGEAGAELVGNINGRTGVVSQGEISGIRASVEASGNVQASLLKQQNALLSEIARNSANGSQVSISSVLNAMDRTNRRAGKPVVQMG